MQSRLVVSIGELLIDFVPGEPGVSLLQAATFRKAAGGAPANVAVQVARLGGKSAFIGRVGDDPFGHYLRDTLAAAGVDVRGVILDGSAPTTLAFVSLSQDADRDFSFYRTGTADTRLNISDLDRQLLDQAGVLHYCSVSLSHEPARSATLHAAQLARASGALVSFDVNWRPALWDDGNEGLRQIREAILEADLLKLSETELELLCGTTDPDSAADLLSDRLRLVVVSLGAEGVQLVTRGSSVHVPSFPVTPADTTGAGDALAGALLHELSLDPQLIHKPAALLAATRRATAVAALSTLKPGAVPSYPDQQELEEFLAQF